jgi:2',3'-cyclic-nucleotide 2'-phosphodiesterase (5'-nucleotidase family)
VDLIIGGGSDTLLAGAGWRLRDGERREGDYPLRTRGADGAPTLIVSTAGQYRYVGRVLLEFDGRGEIVLEGPGDGRDGPYATDQPGVVALWTEPEAAIAPGSKAARVRTLTDAVSRVVMAKDQRILGLAGVFLEGRREAVRSQETNLGDLVADALLAAALERDPSTRIALVNGGGIRAPIGAVHRRSGDPVPPQGNPRSGKPPLAVSRLDVENTLRFNNGLSLLSLSAAQLKEVLEYAVAASAPGVTPGRFPQVAGMAFSFDPGRRPGERIRSLGVSGPAAGSLERVVVHGRVVGDPARRFRVVLPRFIADGGDGYPLPAMGDADGPALQRVELRRAGAGASGFSDAGTEQDALASYLLARHRHQPFLDAETPPARDQRIQNLSARTDTVLHAVTAGAATQ